MKRSLEQVAWGCLVACAFATPVSLPAARVLLALTLVLLVVQFIRSRRRPVVPPVVWLALAFIAVACVVTPFGVNPQLGVPKLRKLVWFAGIPVAAALVTSPSRLIRLLGALALGCGALAVKAFVAKLPAAVHAARAGEAPGVVAALVDMGSMTNSQRFMLGMIAALGFLIAARLLRRRAWPWAVLFALQGVALVINFKRGAWISAGLACSVFAIAKADRRHRRLYALLLALGLVALGALPPVRARLAGLRDEFTGDYGGRITMWTEVAPALIRAHPWGIGYRSLTNELMREHVLHVEPGRDHLHSNPVQVLVATGWLGLAIYLAWMTVSVLDASRLLRGTRGGDPAHAVHALALLLLLAALLMNGLVEYNFADGEIVMAYGLLMGAAAAGRKWSLVNGQWSLVTGHLGARRQLPPTIDP